MILTSHDQMGDTGHKTGFWLDEFTAPDDALTEAGEPLVSGRKVTGFTNTEEEAVQLTGVVPFLVEDMLKSKGGEYSRGDDWASYVVTDGKLITGQNPTSSEAVAEAVLKALKH